MASNVTDYQRKFPVWRAARVEELEDLRVNLRGWKEPIIDIDYREDSRHFVLDGGGELFGCSSMGIQSLPENVELDQRPERTPARFWAVAIHPSFRGKGHWTKLHQQRMKIVKALGASLIWSNVRPQAQELYATHGFEFISSPWVDPNSDAEVRTMMAMPFEPDMDTRAMTIIDPERLVRMRLGLDDGPNYLQNSGMSQV